MFSIYYGPFHTQNTKKNILPPESPKNTFTRTYYTRFARAQRQQFDPLYKN